MKLKHRVEYLLFAFLTQIVRILGIKNTRIVARVLAVIVYYFIPIRKKVVFRNLEIAFPQKSKKEIRKIAFRNYISIAIAFLEIPLINYMTSEYILSNTDFSKLDLMKKKVKPGPNGLIFLTAHYGNWELGAVTMGLWMGQTISVLAKEQKNTLVSTRMKKIREKFGNREILLGVSVRELYKTLKEGGSIGVVADQRAPKKSMRVNYFGRPTAAFPGAASLAIKLKPPIFIVLFRRINNGRYMLEVEEISYDNLPENNEDAIRELTQRYFAILEKYVRISPEQWFWMHNIWKH